MQICSYENPIKVWREYRELTQQQLAEIAGISKPYLSQIETGKRIGTAEILSAIAKALDVSRGMGKEESRPVESGVGVRTVSFERLVQELAADHQLFVMDRKGTPMREQVFADNPCFLLTDHIPMPKNTFHSLERLGAKKITLGSTMLFASQCIVLIHHELDQR